MTGYRNFEKRVSVTSWEPIGGAPQDGRRIRLAHSESVYSTFGFWDEATSSWVIEAAFIVERERQPFLVWQPELWACLPEFDQQEAS